VHRSRCHPALALGSSSCSLDDLAALGIDLCRKRERNDRNLFEPALSRAAMPAMLVPIASIGRSIEAEHGSALKSFGSALPTLASIRTAPRAHH
jgi:hypothetical protein